MYESPINIIEKAVNDLLVQQEEGVFRMIKEYGITVDKEELLKALAYDRNQYDKGYDDGVREFIDRLKDEVCQLLDLDEMLERIAKEMGAEL